MTDTPATPIPIEAKLAEYGYANMHEFRNWRWFKKYAGGPMSDLGAHQIDVYNWMLGVNPSSCMASGGVDYYKTHEWYDNAIAIFEQAAAAIRDHMWLLLLPFVSTATMMGVVFVWGVATAFVLTALRVGGLLLVAPAWSAKTFPMKLRTALLVVFATLLIPSASATADLATLLNSWGAKGGAADIDRNGSVDAADLAVLLGAWTG
jgi:hypothetical protein